MDRLVKKKNILNIVFRTDASIEIGTGHVMRCLTLADALRCKGASISFICRKQPGDLSAYIESRGYKVSLLPFINQASFKIDKNVKHSAWLGVDWERDANETKEVIKEFACVDGLIVDHYALDKKWEEKLKTYTRNIVVIDDLADRQHVCNIILDQNYYKNVNQRYKKLVPKDCVSLLGPRYGLLRPEFLDERKNLRKKANVVETLLVFFGGSDPTKETYKVARILADIEPKLLRIEIVVGQSNTQKSIIQDLCRKYSNMNFHYHVNYMSRLMREADLAICAGGSTTWERYCLGLPSILIAVADNQIEVCEAVNSLGIDWYIGKSEEVYKKDIITALLYAKEEFDLINRSKKALKIVDGHGANRAANEILKYSIGLN